MEDVQDEGEPSWANMLRDVLVKIFTRLSLEEMLKVVPRVCRTWKCVSQDAACWQKVDLEEWSQSRSIETGEKMIKLLVDRSQGGLREICFPTFCTDDMLRLITPCESLLLQVLRIPRGTVTEDCICQLTTYFPLITYLDISNCFLLSKKSVESFGKNCPHISRLNVNMHPYSSDGGDDVAFTIGQYMPQLKHLEMVYGSLSNVGLKALLEKCTSLEYLDLRGCRWLNMEESFTKEARNRLKVLYGPLSDMYNFHESDVSSYYADSDAGMWDGSDSDDLEMDMHDMIDDLEMDMHEEMIDDFCSDASLSP